MYCVKCGVRLQDGVEKCPLCNTPVHYPESEITQSRETFPQNYPIREHTYTTAAIFSVLCLIGISILLVVCFNLYGRLSWGGYPVFGICLFYVFFILPMWFPNRSRVIFIPVNHIAAALYLLYVNYAVNGDWFLTFALPICIISCIYQLTLACIVKYVHKGYYYIAGSFIIAAGVCAIIVEFFEHITFGTRMFLWSLYVLSCCFFIGMFFIIAGIVKPLQRYLNKRFFI
ncbi:MAG: hypothetical protein IJM15_01135 [Erysipelotrichaceae bacterium]|nr:hypothetical protein [Erysipelotrichaceae bacterium]